MGQSSNFMLNRVGTFMYWENSWINELNSKNFQTKIFFLQKLIFYFFSDRFFNYFFFQKSVTNENLDIFHKIVKVHKTLRKQTQNLSKKLNMSRSWFVKYKKFIILSIFCFFFKPKNKLVSKYKKRKFFVLFRQRRFKKTKRLLLF